MQVFISTLIDGLNIGSIYALVALGYTMVYGIAKMLNFAHGDVIMVGGFTVLVSITQLGLPLPLTILLVVAFSGLLGFSIEKLAYKPLRKASSLSVLITAIGVSYLLQNLALLIFGSRRQFMPQFIISGGFNFAGVEITYLSIINIGTMLVIMLALHLFINKTKMGSAMLAVSEDKGAAQLMGVNVNKTISITFIIGSCLAGVAAILYSARYLNIEPYAGSLLGIKAFSAAVFGGIGSIPGAMIGGLLIGLIEAFTVAYLPGQFSEISDGVAFAILIVILIMKPTGILGKKKIEKV